TFEATDASGNTAECSFTVTVIDNENPEITCPSNITETVAIGQTGKIINYTLPVFNDKCSASIQQTAGF
ncbi:MAG: HYR domain-containing protein, partial [Bacteroidota bacterium]